MQSIVEVLCMTVVSVIMVNLDLRQDVGSHDVKHQVSFDLSPDPG
jgi:hypothetical protein